MRSLLLATGAAATVLFSLLPATVAQAAVPPCAGDTLVAKVTDTDAGMSEQVVYITVRKKGRKRCSVSGYPFLARMVAKDGTKVFAQAKGGTAMAPNPPRERIILKRGQRAHFTLSASTAYDTAPITFRRVRFAPMPGVTPLSANIRLQANRTQGRPYVFTTSVFARGVGKAD